MKILNKLMGAMIVVGAMNLPAHADDAHHASTPTQASSADSTMAQGEIRKVNKEAGKLTIKHGELKNLDMPPMTMVFLVKDKAMLDQVKPGDKVGFVAEKVGGKLTVMQLERVN